MTDSDGVVRLIVRLWWSSAQRLREHRITRKMSLFIEVAKRSNAAMPGRCLPTQRMGETFYVAV